MMPIIGAFMGGTAGTIPSGYGVLEMYWTTNDGENISGVTFNISNGTSLVADSNGFAKATLPVGTYTVSVTHGGIYGGDGEKTVTISNRESASLIWSASRIYKQTVSLLFPISASANWTVTNNSSGTVEFSGTSISSSITFQVYPGVYTFSMTLYGDSASKTLEISSSGTFDMADLFCKITVSQPFSGSVLGVTYNGTSIGNVTSFSVIRTTSSRTMSFSGTIASYSGLSSSAIAELKSSSVTPSSAEITVKPTVIGKIVLLTSTGTLNIPVAGKYSVFCIGGGASSMYGYWGGGGSGYVVYDTFDVPAGDITITIGNAGGTTSFGTIASASGGSMSSNYKGGEGGAGGGAGSSTGNNTQRAGGKGYFGGGGGGGGAQGSSSTAGGNAGAGGLKGGNGGSGGSSRTSGSASAGSSGKSASSEAGALYYSGSYGGGSAGGNYGGGGGGGGGFGAVGGKGGPGTDTSYGSYGGGGGGGGGIAGGTGGNGSGVGQAATAGRGYGAGGRGGESASNANIGGGGGGYGSTQIANGPDGAKGCVVIRWMS